MDSRHELEIGSAFAGQVNTGVPVELVEAENQPGVHVLTGERDRQNVSAPEEAMDIGVEAPTGLEGPQLSSGDPRGVAVGSSRSSQHLSAIVANSAAQMQMAVAGNGSLPAVVNASGARRIPNPPHLIPSTQLTSSIGVDTTQLSSSMGMSGDSAGDLRRSAIDHQLQQLQQVNRALGGATALEIAPDSITFPSTQGSLSQLGSSVQAAPNDSIVIERARQILKNYSDLDISGAIADPSEGAGSATMDTSSALADPEAPSSPESNFDSSELLNTSMLQQDDVMSKLAQAGPMGIATAAAVMSSGGRKKKRIHSFETNPALRKRHCSKLVKKLKDTIDELTSRVGLQAAVVMYRPGKHSSKAESTFKVFGAAPLIGAVRSQRDAIISEMDDTLHQHDQSHSQVVAIARVPEPSLQELPPLVFDGIPTPVHKMTQAQLRAFIPSMLKFSTGRGKPGWGKVDFRPPWWPLEVPWANVRSDCRTEEQKKSLSWTDALRRIVICCYLHHGRIDLLPEFSAEQLQQMLSPEAAEQLQIQLTRLQQQGEFQSDGGTHLRPDDGGTHLIVGGGHPPELVAGENQQVFTVDTGMGNCDTSGMPTLADATLAETATRLQQVADETGQVQYATQTVTVTDRDAKALGQPVGSTTTVLLTAYPGGHSGADTSQQYLAQASASVAAANLPSVQVVYSASHIDSIPDSIVSSISTSTPSTALTFSLSSSSTTLTSTLPISSQPTLPPPSQPHSGVGDSSTEYLNPATSSVMSPALENTPPELTPTNDPAHDDLASQLINHYPEPSSFGAGDPTVVAMAPSIGGVNSDSPSTV